MSIFNKNSPEQSIILEEIDFLSVPLVTFYLFRNYRIYCFSINQTIERRGIIQKLILEKRIIKIEYSDLDLILQLDLNKVVLDEIEKIYEENFQKNKTISGIASFVGSDLSSNAFKKRLSFSLYDFYRMNLFFDRFFPSSKENGELLFIPGKIYQELKKVSQVREMIANNKRIKTPLIGKVYTHVLALVIRLKYCSILFFFPIWILLKIRIPSFKKEIKQSFSVGIRLSNSDWPLGNKYRRFDFLVDNVYLTRANTLFCIEETISDSVKQKILDNNYNYVEIRELLRNADFNYCKNTFFKSFLPSYMACLKNAFLEHLFIVQLCPEIMFRFLLWTRFENKYQICHYVTYNEHLPSDIIRNIILENQGVSTWLYAHSMGSNDFISKAGHEEIMEKIWAYFHYDNYVVWGEKMKMYYQKHPHNIKNFHKLGCLWSEHVRIIKEQGLANDTLKALCRKFVESNTCPPRKIIGVFDGSTGDDAPLTETDLMVFINGILQILEDYPGFGVIFKKKRSYKKISLWSPNLVEFYKKIENHPRCYLTDELDSDPSETIAASDLVISAPFTSPSIESLSAKKRAIYFDATGRFRDTYYDQLPKFVAHDYVELRKAIDYWLNEVSDEEFLTFLNRYVLQELDEYLDGMAITRFRQKLC